MAKKPTSKRNPVAKAVRTRTFRPRVIKDKRQDRLKRDAKRDVSRETKGGNDEIS